MRYVGSGKTTKELQKEIEEQRRVVDAWELRERHKLDEEKRARAEVAEEEQIRRKVRIEGEKIRQEPFQQRRPKRLKC